MPNFSEPVKVVKIELTPERKERMRRAADKIVDILMAETESSVEGLATLQFVVDAIQESQGGKYHGMITFGKRDDN